MTAGNIDVVSAALDGDMRSWRSLKTTAGNNSQEYSYLCTVFNLNKRNEKDT